MDPRTRWETEALRRTPSPRPGPPRPTAKRTRPGRDDREWATLREAEAATSIPVNTLRKWVRRAGLPSYLESDGETPVRMVDLDAVRQRARELGREIAPEPRSPGAPEPDGLEARAASLESRERTEETGRSQPETQDPTTMLVPVDAWNKMLAQLGNLHEAGQQLAAARERAAKAETEAEFLRRRLAELRTDPMDAQDVHGAPAPPSPTAAVSPPSEHPTTEGPEPPGPSGVSGHDATTSYWRYLTVGWRNRRRRRAPATDPPPDPDIRD